LQGLAMRESLITNDSNSYLYIFAFDEICYEILIKLQLKNTTIISLNAFEDDQLKSVKPDRTPTEYFWTCSSSIILYVFNKYNVSNCTYVDADIFFYNSPQKLINQLPEGKNVIISRHNYSLRNEYLLDRGQFCVQFVYFENNPDAILILKEWRDDCINWCYSRIEEGKFGDQKYLDIWPQKYRNVYVLNCIGAGIAPWNIDEYSISFLHGKLITTRKKDRLKSDLYFYHFHGLKLFSNKRVIYCVQFLLNANVKRYIYLPYVKRLWKIEDELIKKNNFKLEGREQMSLLRNYRDKFYLWRRRYFVIN
jgi:hypothetical protein